MWYLILDIKFKNSLKCNGMDIKLNESISLLKIYRWLGIEKISRKDVGLKRILSAYHIRLFTKLNKVLG